MFVLKKYRYIFSFIQLIFSFLFFSSQSFAYEQDIYFSTPNDDTSFMASNIMRRDYIFYFNNLSKQYLKYQTPYPPFVPKPEIGYDEQTKEDIQTNEPETANTISAKNLGKIVIIIDDMGINRKKTQKIAELKYPLTVSFLTYAPHLKEQIEQSQNSGQEIMAHIPMEPSVMQNYTPQMLTIDMTDEEIKKNIENMLQQIPQAVGINNHMGSKFTEDEHCMAIIMQVLAEKNLVFVDSKTSAKTVGIEQARLFNVESYIRDVFLDNEDDYNYILSQLQKTEKIALEKGYAIAIGHPKEQTYQTLKDWLPTLKEKGLKIVPISQIKNGPISEE